MQQAAEAQLREHLSQLVGSHRHLELLESVMSTMARHATSGQQALTQLDTLAAASASAATPPSRPALPEAPAGAGAETSENAGTDKDPDGQHRPAAAPAAPATFYSLAGAEARGAACHSVAQVLTDLGQARTILADARHALHTWSERSVAASASLSSALDTQLSSEPPSPPRASSPSSRQLLGGPAVAAGLPVRNAEDQLVNLLHRLLTTLQPPQLFRPLQPGGGGGGAGGGGVPAGYSSWQSQQQAAVVSGQRLLDVPPAPTPTGSECESVAVW